MSPPSAATVHEPPWAHIFAWIRSREGHLYPCLDKGNYQQATGGVPGTAKDGHATGDSRCRLVWVNAQQIPQPSRPLGDAGPLRLVADDPMGATRGATAIERDAQVSAGLRELESVGESLRDAGQASNTKRAYASAWVGFDRFCGEHDLVSLPAHPRTVCWYVAWMASQRKASGDGGDLGQQRFKIGTVRVHLAAIAHEHRYAGLLDPTRHGSVVELMRGWARTYGARPVRKEPLLLEQVLTIVGGMEHGVYPGGVSAARDTAALWLGFAGALRRSEAATLLVSSLTLHARDGVHLHVGSSKTDQEDALPDLVVLPYGTRNNATSCPACAIHRWLHLVLGESARAELSVRERRREVMSVLLGEHYQGHSHVCGRDGGFALVSNAQLRVDQPLLRATYRNRHDAGIRAEGISGDALNSMLHKRMSEVDMDPHTYGFHSLRAGHVTQARRNGASTEAIMRAGRWRRAATVDIYDREFDPAARNSVMSLGL